METVKNIVKGDKTLSVKRPISENIRKKNKLGEWLQNPNRETLVIYDMRAVLK